MILVGGGGSSSTGAGNEFVRGGSIRLSISVTPLMYPESRCLE